MKDKKGIIISKFIVFLLWLFFILLLIGGLYYLFKFLEVGV